jgi:ABC-type uncharacterized transport system permease subunit
MQSIEDTEERLKKLLSKLLYQKTLTLDQQLVSEIKQIAKQSEQNVKSVWQKLAQSLTRKSSQVRFLTVLLCAELFSRSSAFRKLLVDNLFLFVSSCIGRITISVSNQYLLEMT